MKSDKEIKAIGMKWMVILGYAVWIGIFLFSVHGYINNYTGELFGGFLYFFFPIVVLLYGLGFSGPSASGEAILLLAGLFNFFLLYAFARAVVHASRKNLVLTTTGVIITLVSAFGGPLLNGWTATFKQYESVERCNNLFRPLREYCNRLVKQEIALKTDPSHCMLLSGTADKSYCLSNVGIATGDPQICMKVTDEYYRIPCVTWIAIHKKDISVCSTFKGGHQCFYQYAYETKSPNACNELLHNTDSSVRDSFGECKKSATN